MVDLIFDLILRLILPDRSYTGSAREVEEFKEMINTHLELVGAFYVRDYIPFLGWLHLQVGEMAMKKFNRRRDEILQRLIDKCRLCMKTENAENLIDVLINYVDKAHDDDTIVKATFFVCVSFLLNMRM